MTSLAYIQSYAAASLGYLADEGLDVELIDTGGGGPDVQLVLGGRAETTVNDGAQILPAPQQGQRLVCVLSLLDRSIVNATMSADTAARLGLSAQTPFADKLRALKGLKIGVTRPGALTWQQARYNLVSAGLDPDRDAEVIGVGGAPALAAALQFGSVDVIYISLPIGERLVQQRIAMTLVDNARGEDPNLGRFMMEGLWARADFIAENRDLMGMIVRAYRRASGFVASSTPEAVAAAVEPALGSLGADVLLEGVRRVQPAVSRSGLVGPEELETTQTLLAQNGILTRSFALDEVFDASFI